MKLNGSLNIEWRPFNIGKGFYSTLKGEIIQFIQYGYKPFIYKEIILNSSHSILVKSFNMAGYFIQVEQDCYFEMDGEKFSQDKIGYLGSGKLGKGWNLMGSVSVEEVFNKGTCSLYGGVGPIKYVYNVNSCKDVKGWNKDYQECREEYGVWRCGCSVGILEPGLGYWIRTANDCSLA